MKHPPFPDEGKVVVLSPDSAVRLFDVVASQHHKRIFASPVVADDKAFVIDMDEVSKVLSLSDIDPYRFLA